MEIQYLNIILTLLAFTFLTLFFIFTTAMAVYLKIFIQKGSGAKEFIASKYTGGISNSQFKSIRTFYIFYDLFMLGVLSFITFAMPVLIVLGEDGKLFQIIVLYLFLICSLVIIVPINELKGIARPKWIIRAGAPEGIIMIWQKGSKFGYFYNFISKYFIYIFLLLAVVSFVMFSI